MRPASTSSTSSRAKCASNAARRMRAARPGRATRTPEGRMTETLRMDINEVLRRLPHRYPFLLVDRVLECESGKAIRAIKNVTYNENFFPGHFPHRPVFPGVMILEALAQTAGILAFVTAGQYPDAER